MRKFFKERKMKTMVYTVQMDLYIHDDELYPDEDIKNFIKENMNAVSASVDHIKVIEVND